MPYTLRALSLGKILREAFSIYREHSVLFLSISAIPNLVLLSLQLGLKELPINHPDAAGMAAWAEWGASAASLFAGSIVTAATTVAVSDIYMDRQPDLWDSFARLSGKAFKIVYAAFLVELTITLGTLLCLVPGIFWAGKYGLTIPAVVLEDVSGTQALKRSGELATDAIGRIVIVFFLTSIFTGLTVAALNQAALALGFLPSYHRALTPGTLTPEVLRLVTTTLGGIVFGPISAIALALEYFDQRVRKEGFEVAHMTSQMNAPKNLASGASVS
jgi:hypothetical protein